MCSCVCEVEDLKNMQSLIYRRAVDIAGECPVTSLCDMFNDQQDFEPCWQGIWRDGSENGMVQSTCEKGQRIGSKRALHYNMHCTSPITALSER